MLRFGAVCWDFRSSSEEFQTRLKLTDSQWNEMAEKLRSNSHVLLVTCNRVEFYFTFDSSVISEEDLTAIYPSLLLSQDAIRHLFRVASGLESMSVGENEILAQIKAAYEKSRSSGGTDKLTSLIFRKAISVGKAVREKTSISRGKTSIPVIAVDLASRKTSLKSSRIGIVGTGQMAETFIKYLQKKEPGNITVVGRNIEKARALSELYGCTYAGVTDLGEVVNSSDAIFTATSSKNILITRSMLNGSASKKTLVDISNPRNIDPALDSAPGVNVYSLDNIKEISLENSILKKEEIPRAEEIVDAEFDKFKIKLREFRAEELLTKSHTYAESIAIMEINRMMKEIDKGMDPSEAKKRSASAMVNRILGNYTTVLKEAAIKGDTEFMAKLQEIFG